MPNLNLPRDVLSRLAGGNPLAIRQLEKLFGTVDGIPSTVEEANALAGSALAVAQAAIEALVELAGALERMDFAPAQLPFEPDEGAPMQAVAPEYEDVAPRVQIGTLGMQDSDSAVLDGPLTSTVAIGTAPFVVASTTRVDNLNVERAGRADSLGTASSYPADATDLPTVIALANALKAANQSKGV